MRYTIFGLIAGILLFIPAAIADRWVGGANVSCFNVCLNSKMQPVTSGKHGNGEEFTICRDANTNRPGWNLRPTWRNKCYVAEDGQEKGVMSYECLCR
jgi:hypothetical protein